MLYSNDKINKKENVKNKTWMDTGINENCTLNKIVHRENESGTEFLAFYFTNEAGEEVSKTEWKPRDGNNKEQKALNQLIRIKHIVTTYIPEKEFDVKADSFKELSEYVIKSIPEDKTKDVKVRLKVVKDSKGYNTLPSYTFNGLTGTKYAFIERMEDKQKMEITSYDSLENPVKSNNKDENSGNNDLPF